MDKSKAKFIGIFAVLVLAAGGVLLYAKSQPSNVAKNESAKKEIKEQFLPGMKSYTHDAPAFQLQYPERFRISHFEEGNGEKIIFDGNEKGQWFQIFVSPYDEPGPVTPDRIKKDLPDLVIENPQTLLIGGEQALVFFGRDESLGKTREAWIIHDNYLYQVVSYTGFDAVLAHLMTTWKFEL